MTKRDRLLLIEWDDASHSDGSWKDRSEYQRRNKPLRCQSIGWVIADTDECMTLCASRNPYGEWSGDTVIPKSFIRKRRLLTYK